MLIGATAMGFHGVVRATEDLDLFVKATAENIERLRAAFRAAYNDDPSIEEISTDDLLGDYPAVRYYPPTGDLYFDVLTRLGDASSFDTVESEARDFEGTRVTVATEMAVQRFRSLEDMNSAQPPKDASDFDRFLRHCTRYWVIAPREYPRGVFRFRSVDQMTHPIRPSTER